MQQYECLLRPEQKDGNKPQVITIIREPVAHYLSHFSFYVEPSDKFRGNLEQFVRDGRASNMLSLEFGIKTPDELHSFLEDTAGGPQPWIMLTTERLQQGLVFLAITNGW